MKLQKILALIMCIVMLAICSCFSTYAYTADELRDKIEQLEQQEKEIQAELNKLKGDKKDQQAIKATIEKKINNLQAQIDACNSKIAENNAAIAKNEKEIAEKNQNMEEQIFEFKQRIRAIYMSSSTAGGLEILLGAESFSDFIALSQLTQNVSKRDQRMVNDIITEIKEIEEKKAENQKLIEEQKTIKATLTSKQDELDKEVAEVNRVISNIQSSVNQSSQELAGVKSQAEDWQEQLDALTNTGSVDSSPFAGIFAWPVPGFTDRTSEYGERWSRQHAGIDIAQGGIAGANVVAAGSGTVTVVFNSCSHNYGKDGAKSCGYYDSKGNWRRCGGGYGNYLYIDHGIYKGEYYRTVYAHLYPGSITVRSGQKVGKGQVIGRVGTTGSSTGYHLHYEIRHGTTSNNLVADNPMKFY